MIQTGTVMVPEGIWIALEAETATMTVETMTGEVL